MGNCIYYCFNAGKELYDERNYWLGLVDDLAAEEPPSRSPEQKKKSPQPHSSPKSNNVQSSEDQLFENTHKIEPPTYQESNTPKGPKVKTRGTSNQPTHSSEPKEVSLEQFPSCNIEHDQKRRDNLNFVKDMYSKIVPKSDIEALYKKAAKFVGGNTKIDGNKVTVKWCRETKDRSVTFELAHKQHNEKSSNYKGYKLKAVLDAVTQIYLDGWDRDHILSYLEDRTSLYNLQSKFWYILWSSPDEEGEA